MSNVKLFAIFMFLFSGFAFGQGLEPVHDLPKIDEALSKESGKPTFEMHGDFTLWYYRPNQSWVDENFSIYSLNVLADSTFENYGVHVELRASDIWFRTYYLSNVWFQEIYGYIRDPSTNYIIKVGKEYTHFGHFWDGSYYGNIPYFDGIAMSPDDGISWEGSLPNLHGWNLDYYLQYFVIDGGTNGSLTADGQKGEGGPGGVETGSGAPTGGLSPSDVTGRDLISNVGSHKRNEIIIRAEPSVPLFNGKLTLGLNYEYMLADIVDGVNNTTNTTYFNATRLNIHRQAFDINYANGPFNIFFEWIHQHGQTSIDFPYPTVGAEKVDYYWAGVSYKWRKFTGYYNYSQGNYYDLVVNNGQDYTGDTVGIHDIVQVPGISYEFKKYISFAVEYGYWYRTHSGNFSMNDNSVNLYLRANM